MDITFPHHLFYAPPEAFREGEIVFPEDDSHHMLASLRLGAGDLIGATDGMGKLFRAELLGVRGRRAVARVIEVREVPRPRVSLALYQGLVRPQKMDLIVEKCVELGAGSIRPILTERSLKRRAGGRVKRWEKIAAAAMKQSLRAYLPEILPLSHIQEATAGMDHFDRVLVAQGPGGGQRLSGEIVSLDEGRLALFVGPEGGFTHGEIARLADHGATAFTLGDKRLRSETAAIASVAVIASSW